MELTNRCCLITGSTGTLGKAITLAMARAGADCICHYHSHADAAGQLAGEVVRLGRKAMLLQADLRQPQEIEALFEKARTFGALRMLVNSAAMFGRRNLADITPQTARDILDTNLIAPLLLSQGFVKLLKAENHQKNENGCAKIINIADVGGMHPWAGYAEYCMSKAGLIGLTKVLAKELAPQITVNAIAPGIVTWPQPPEHPGTQKQLARIPLGRFAKPEEIVDTVLYLLNNDYVTGQVIQVDGGAAI
jgi:NAD(P)-dependent dehydrogenase (short-subunit alcohol dehydrogenase family)